MTIETGSQPAWMQATKLALDERGVPATLYSWRDVDHFHSCWEMVRAAKRPDAPIVIWWDTPNIEYRGEVALDTWCTPVEWALCLPDPEAGVAVPKIWIIGPSCLGLETCFAFQLRHSVSVATGWVRVSELDSSELEQDLAWFASRDVKSLASNLTVLRTVWANRIGSVENRHALGNLFGSLALRRALLAVGRPVKSEQSPAAAGGRTAPRERAIEILLDRLGILAAEFGDDGVQVPQREGSLKDRKRKWKYLDPRQRDFVKRDVFEQFASGPKCLLIDDQAEALGYGEVLDAVLGGDVSRHSTPDILLSWLKSLPERLDWGAPRMLAGDYDILFLDLRLFDERRTEEELAFLQQLLELPVVCSLREAPAILAVDAKRAGEMRVALDAAIERLQALAGKSNGLRTQTAAPSAGYLALIPLLLSWVDRSFPIVIFSSSQQRQLVELLRPWPNIVTTFRKPAPTGHGTPRSSLRYLDELCQACVRAFQIHEDRVLWRSLIRLEDQRQLDQRALADEFRSTKWRGHDVPLPPVSELHFRMLVADYSDKILTGRYLDAVLGWDHIFEAWRRRPPKEHSRRAALLIATQLRNGQYLPRVKYPAPSATIRNPHVATA